MKILQLLTLWLMILTFTSCTVYNSVRDIDGNRYRTVKTGKHEWMTENLRTSRFNDGTTIVLVRDTVGWISATKSAHCYFKNNAIIYGSKYGAFYNWYAVESGKLCPAGWHVPTEEEWKSLIALTGRKADGGKLKAKNYQYWKYPNTAASDKLGFAARGSGYRNAEGEFVYLYEKVVFWTSTQANSREAWTYGLEHESGEVFRKEFDKVSGLSVRCVKD